MNRPQNHRVIRGVSVGSIAAFVGVLLMIVWSVWPGLLVVLLGLVAFDGFARRSWDPDIRLPGHAG